VDRGDRILKHQDSTPQPADAEAGYKHRVAKAERPRRDIPGSLLGILTFLGGVALLLLTFRLAYDLFTVPPQDALGLRGAKELNAAAAGNSLSTILIRILLLFVMGFVGSMVANRGITLYSASRPHRGHREKE
jgi:hypothetical protein